MFFSTPPYHGTLRRYHVHPEAWLHRLPDSLTFEEGSLLEPLSVALAGIDRSGLRLGDPLVICGAGPIGLVTLLAANAAGANPIVITDLDETRLKMAQDLVPRVRPVVVSRDDTPEALGSKIVSTLGEEAHLVIECTGVESSVHAGIYVRSLPIRIRFWKADLASRPRASAEQSLLSALGRTSRASPSCTFLPRKLTCASSTATTTRTQRQSAWWNPVSWT